MCGIAGFFQYSSSDQTLQPEVIRAMTRALEHRGPDEEGFYEEGSIRLGHRRLKVIDLNGGKQPMQSDDQKHILSYNGEIYNFKELRRQLESQGRRFVSQSDTESLLQHLIVEGMRGTKDLEGMFAFAYYEKEKEILHLAVDPFGKKPLYYANRNGQFIFASELKSLLKHPSISKTVSSYALSQYLAFEYVPAPHCIIDGVSKLEGGMRLEVSAEGIKKYSYIPLRENESHGKTEAAWMGDLIEALKTSVQKRLVSDVPLGVFLSGGLDSSAVLAMVRAVDPARKLKTFTIGFEEASFDESKYAKEMSRHFGTEHIEERLTLQQMVKEHEGILNQMDEPLADASFIPTLLLCRLVRQHVTVALSGDGGDELFCGYPTFVADVLARRLDHLPKGMLRWMGSVVNKLPVSMENLSFDFKAKQFFKGMPYPHRLRSQVWLGSFTPEEQKPLLTDLMGEHADKSYDVMRQTWGEDTGCNLKELEEFYLRFYLQGDILVKSDRASMANSLEVRSPLLDDQFAAIARQVPMKFKLSGKVTKAIFKKCMRDRIPSSIIDRPKKGFGIPVAQWIRKDLKGHFQHAFLEKRVKRDGIFNSGAIQSLFDQHLAGQVDHRKKLWTLYVFQQWLENL